MTRFAPSILCLILAAGCVETREMGVRYGRWGTRIAEEQPRPDVYRSTSTEDADGGWAIALDQFTGERHQEAAKQRQEQLTAASGFQGIWVADEGNSSVVCYGRYDSPLDRDARRDLVAWKRLAVDRQVSLPAILFIPVGAAHATSVPELDLRRAANRGMYTLQVGFFEGEKGRVTRQGAAETYAQQLREDGNEAFYFHGPIRSMVTVGVFGGNDVYVQASGEAAYGPAVQQLQQKFPHNLGNGSTIIETRTGGHRTPQPSFLVAIPGADMTKGGTSAPAPPEPRRGLLP